MPSAVRAHHRGRPIVLPGAILFWHLRRKAARIDAEIDERVDDDGADERDDDDDQHLQTECAHIGSLPNAGLWIKSGDSKKHARAAARSRRRCVNSNTNHRCRLIPNLSEVSLIFSAVS